MTSTDRTPNRTTRKRLRTRERLYQAAVSLIAERGYDETTITDIAEQANTARATAFNHFPTKGAFTMEWTHRRRREAEAVANSTIPADIGVIPRLRAYFAHLASVNGRERTLTVNMIHGWLHAEGPVRDDPWLSTDLVSWIESAQDNGEIAPSVDPSVAANLLRDAYLGVIFRWIRDPDDPPTTLQERMAQSIDLVLDSLVKRS